MSKHIEPEMEEIACHQLSRMWELCDEELKEAGNNLWDTLDATITQLRQRVVESTEKCGKEYYNNGVLRQRVRELDEELKMESDHKTELHSEWMEAEKQIESQGKQIEELKAENERLKAMLEVQEIKAVRERAGMNP